MNNVVKLDIYYGDTLIQSKCIDVMEWYESDVEEIESEEFRRLHHISIIRGTQYEENGDIYEFWNTYYDSLGRINKAERFDSGFNLIDVSEIKYDSMGNQVTR